MCVKWEVSEKKCVHKEISERKCFCIIKKCKEIMYYRWDYHFTWSEVKKQRESNHPSWTTRVNQIAIKPSEQTRPDSTKLSQDLVESIQSNQLEERHRAWSTSCNSIFHKYSKPSTWPDQTMVKPLDRTRPDPTEANQTQSSWFTRTNLRRGVRCEVNFATHFLLF